MIQFRLKELIAEKERLEGVKVTYRDIQEATGINLNTLTAMANNDMKQIHLSTIERLCDYFGCSIERLMALDDEVDPQQKFRMQLYERIGKRIDQQRILPQQWSLPGHLDYAIRVEIMGIPKSEIRSLFYIFKNGSLFIGLSIETRDRQQNQGIFEQLKMRKHEIEAAFGHPIAWEDPIRIRYELPLQYLDRQSHWPEIQDDMIETWERMLEAFRSPLRQIWQAYEPAITKEFLYQRDLIWSGEGASLITIEDKIKEYATVIHCDICVRQGDNKILRNEASLPQAGHIGSRYEQYRVLLIPQNPGYAKPQRTLQHQKYAEAEKAFLENPTHDKMEILQNTLEQAMPHWTIYGQILSPLLSKCGLTLADIAYINAVRCPTINNRSPSATMTANCKFHLEHWLEWLQPKVVICIGKMVYQEIGPILTAHDIPHTYLNRDRSLSEPERLKNLEEVGRFIRSMIGKSDEMAEPVLNSRSFRQQTDFRQANEIGIPDTSDSKAQEVGDTEIELTSEEQLALKTIKSPTLKKIYLELIDFSKNLPNVEARQIKSGRKLSFRYYIDRNYAFSFIVNQYHLLFYIRGLVLRTLPYVEDTLKQNNIPFEYNPSGDLQIRVSDESPLTFIKKLLIDYYGH